MKHASLFSGIGGPELAASMIGWDNVFHCEINPFGKQILKYWFPNSDSYEDITKTDFKQYRGTIDVLTGGFPCQPFSYAGKRKGQADDRYLWPEMLRVIDEIRPTWVIGENVAGITSMVESGQIINMANKETIFDPDNDVQRHQFCATFTIERICKDLEQKGYTVQPILIPACAVGAPHRRDRVFIIAHASSCGSKSHAQNERTESDRSDKFSQPSKRREQAEFDNGLHSFSRFANNADCLDDLREAGEPSDVRSESEYPAENTLCDGFLCGQEEEQRERERRGNNAMWEDRSLSPNKRWETFPTVSAVHRGNDGLPFDVDDLTIPFSKWRTESIKAYGNAIVPQVMYRIFQCIEQLNL